MNRKQMMSAMAGGLLLSTAAVATNHSDYDYADVIDVDPLTRQVRVSVPRRECFTETRYVTVAAPARSAGHAAAGQMILGGLIGAAIGNQIGGRRSHRDTALAGGLIGAAIGHDMAGRREGARGQYGYDTRDYDSSEVRPIETERCQTYREEHVEERVDGYRVTYRYNGRTYTTRMPHDPGPRLRIRVNVDPVG